MVYGIGHTGPTRGEKHRLGRGASCRLTNAHFAELDTLLSQHLGLRRVCEGRRLRVFEDLATHGLVVLKGSDNKGVVSDRAVAEAAATKKGRIELRKWRSLVARAKVDGADATLGNPSNGALT